jgi:plasminogen activator inhibitor 1 RNA-binding protein
LDPPDAGSDHEKQAAHGWGGQDGNAEYADEKAGEAIAQQDEKEDAVAAGEPEGGADGDAAGEPEPEDKTKSYADYLAEQAANKLSLSAQEIRRPNEGSKQKFPEGKELTRDEDDDFIAGQGGKAKRNRERKEKATTVELDDQRFLAQQRDAFGGRGRGRGGDRGGRGRGEFRGRGRGEGRGDGNRGRGARGGQSGPNIQDSSAFPSLGG